MTIVIDEKYAIGKYTNLQSEDVPQIYRRMQNQVMSLISRARKKINEQDYDFASGLIRQASDELNLYEKEYVAPKYQDKRQSPTQGLRKSISKIETVLVKGK